MDEQTLRKIFAGDEDERLLDALFRGIREPHNDAQHTFCSVWEASELLASDGFEMLFEQDTSLKEYGDSFAKIGIPKVKPIFDRVLALIPPELLLPGNQESLFEHLRNLFAELKNLLYEYFDESKNLIKIVGRYVREHRNDFNILVDSVA